MLFVLLFFLTLTVASNKVSADLGEQEILDELYTSCEKPTLDVPQTVAKLEGLRDFYKNEPKKFLSLRGVTEYLVAIRLSEEAECFMEEVYTKLESLEMSAKDHCNMIQFLEHFKQKYSDRCNGGPEKMYSTILNKIPEASFKELIKMTDSVRSAQGGKFNPSKPFYHDAALIEGIYNYLVELANEAKLIKKKRDGVKINGFSKLYRSKVKSICDQAGDEFKSASKTLLDKFGTSPKVFASFDDSLKSSLYGGSICLDIANKDKNVETLVYYKYDDNKPESVMQYLFYFY